MLTIIGHDLPSFPSEFAMIGRDRAKTRRGFLPKLRAISLYPRVTPRRSATMFMIIAHDLPAFPRE